MNFRKRFQQISEYFIFFSLFYKNPSMQNTFFLILLSFCENVFTWKTVRFYRFQSFSFSWFSVIRDFSCLFYIFLSFFITGLRFQLRFRKALKKTVFPDQTHFLYVSASEKQSLCNVYSYICFATYYNPITAPQFIRRFA